MKKLKGIFILIKILFGILNKQSLLEIKKQRQAKKYGYYTNINELPIFNWFQLDKGNFEYLHKNKKIKTYPIFFKRIYESMMYQFENLDNTNLRKIAELAYLKSLHQTTKEVRFLNLHNTKEAELKKKIKIKKDYKINEIITFIEEVFENIGTIDVYKMSTARFFSLYNRAIKKAEQKQK